MDEKYIKAKAEQLYRHTFAGLLEEAEETPNMILEPYLYLGNVSDAHNIDKLVAKNLINIINVADPAQEGKFRLSIIFRLSSNYFGFF